MTYLNTYGDYKFMPIALGQRETDEGTTCTFYQWGRKDPFRGATANDQATAYIDSQTNYYSSITNPGKFIIGTYGSPYYLNWFDGDLLDLWNVDNSSYESLTSTSVKSIYDPSPVGFKVPPPAAFSSISFGIWNSTSGQEGRSVPSTGDFWRAFGYRACISGSSSSVGFWGFYWSCGPYLYNSNRTGLYLSFTSSSVGPQSCIDYRANGFSVRPVSE